MKKKILTMSCLLTAMYGLFQMDRMYSNCLESGESLLLQNVEALTSENSSSEKLKLKMESCTCSNGKSGKTLKCRKDGNLEDCTPTQQGSKACYKVGLSGLKPC